MIKDLKRVGLAVLIVTIIQISACADDAWDNFKNNAKNAGENSTISAPSDLQADGTSAGFLQKKLDIDFNNHTINGSNYTSDAPLIFSGAGGQSDTKMAIRNATFTDFNVGDNGIINNINPHLELTDVSIINNIGRAINNNSYNQLHITAENNDVTISNDYNGNGIFSNSSIYLNAYDGKTLQIDDNIKIDNSFDGNLNINNTFKSGCDLAGTVYLNGKIDISGQVMLGANTDYKNGILKFGVTPANSTNFNLNVGGESILDLQNNNIDSLKMGKLSGNDDTSLHLKLDYNAKTGKMDVINVDNNAISASMPSLIVDEINILVGGNAHNTQYLLGNGIDLLKISKDTLSSVKDGTTYVFRPDSTKGSYIVSKAKNINSTDSLNHFIMNVPQANENDIAITADMAFSTLEPNNLAGDSRESTIFGNGYTIASSAGNNGKLARVDVGQTLNFNNITLKSFYNDVLSSENNSTINFTSVTLDNSGFNDNRGTLNLYGKNNFTGSETRIGTTSFDTLTGTINILSGTTTNAGERMTAKFLNIGSSDTDAPRVTFNNTTYVATDKLTVINANINNSGTLINKASTYTPTIKNAYIYNTGTMEFETLDNSDSTIKNDGTLKISDYANFEVSSSSKFENDENGIFEGGAIENSGTIINKGQINSGITNYSGGTLTSNIDNIRDDVQLIQGSKFYITGGSFSSSSNNDKIKGLGGDIYITDKVNVAADIIQENFNGKTTVKSDAELVVSSVFGPDQYNIFSNSNLNFEDNSTLNLRDCFGHGGGTIVNDNISSAVGNTLNLKINDSTKLKFQGNVKGNLGISELELKLDNPTSWTLIDSTDLANRTAFTNNFKLIKTNPNVQDINLVWYDNSSIALKN